MGRPSEAFNRYTKHEYYDVNCDLLLCFSSKVDQYRIYLLDHEVTISTNATHHCKKSFIDIGFSDLLRIASQEEHFSKSVTWI